MASKIFLVYLLTLLSCCAVTSAGSVCSSFPYNDLLFLSAYGPAEQFCSAHFPPKTVTVHAPSARRIKAKAKRHVTATTTSSTTLKRVSTTSSTKYKAPTATSTSTTKTSTSKTSTSKTSTSKTSTSKTSTSKTSTSKTSTTKTSTSTSPLGTCTGTCSVWSSCTQQGGGFLSTLCGCIESTVTITVTPTTTSSSTTTPSTTTPSTTSSSTSCPGYGGACTITNNSDLTDPCCNTADNGLYCAVLASQTAGICDTVLYDGDKCTASAMCNEDGCQAAGTTDQLGYYSTCTAAASSR